MSRAAVIRTETIEAAYTVLAEGDTEGVPIQRIADEANSTDSSLHDRLGTEADDHPVITGLHPRVSEDEE